MSVCVRCLTRNNSVQKWPSLEFLIQEWVAQRNEIPSDVLEHILYPIQDSGLSVYELVEDEEDAKLRVVTALQLGRNQSISGPWGCLSFESALLTDLEIPPVGVQGETADATVNGWHRDLEALSTRQAAALAATIARHGSFKSFVAAEMLKCAKDLWNAGDLQAERVSQAVRKQLQG